MKPSEINTLKKLANFLRCEPEFLVSYLEGNVFVIDSNSSGLPPGGNLYRSIIKTFQIPKKNKALGYRRVYQVLTATLHDALIVLNNYLAANFSAGQWMQGFVAGRNIRTNAALHLSKKYVLSLDIKDFFETISETMIEATLVKFGFSDFAGKRLSKIVTVNGVLVQGFSTSPLLSNMVVAELDRQLLELSGPNVVYSRYADDLYFSTNEVLPEIDKIESIMKSNGFTPHPLKTKIMRRGGKQYVTGLTVFDRKIPRIPRRFKRRLRLELFYIKKFGFHSHALRRLGYSYSDYLEDDEIKRWTEEEVNRIKLRIIGWLRFINSVERDASFKLSKEFANCKTY